MYWLTAIALLFALQLVMNLILTVSTKLTDILSSLDIISGPEGDPHDALMGRTRSALGSGSGRVFERFCNLVIFLTMVFLTAKFTFQYLKRLVFMSFLTLISPLIALTYPLDKMGDGKSQAAGMWLKEYVFNALLQPMHLLLYTIFIGGAVDLVKGNPFYALVCLFFLSKAEKFFRTMFGFDRAQSSSAVGAGLIGAAAMAGLQKLTALAKGKRSVCWWN